ncbi:MAG TPA: hypothetical protein VIA18_11175, partial [Polyangia bacterium]|nr:hypothetical protein [Polyangia bacterium]
VKSGTQIYNDTFSQAPPASPSILTNGVPTPVAFVTLGGTWAESNGKAIFSSAGAAPNPALAGSVEDFAELNTNTDPTSNLGLKLATGFAVSSTFDLVAPPTGSYGMELNDGTPTHGVDQLERLIVAKVNGNTVVELVQANLTTNTQTVLASQTLTSAQLAGNNQIEFQFNHAANAQTVSGSFELIDNGVVTSTVNFAPTASIFTNGVDWTRVDIGAFTSQGVGLNVAPGQSIVTGQTLTASAATNDTDATINYQWEKSSSAAFTSFTNVGTNSANYVVQTADAGAFIRVVATTSDPDNSQSATVTSQVTAVIEAAPTVTTPVITGTAQEGQTLTASASSGAGGQAVSYAWYSSADSFTNPIAVGATYLVKEGDEGFDLEAKATVTNGSGVSVSATSAATAAVLDAPPTVTTPIVTGTAQEGQTLTASASAGQSDNPITYAWYSSADNFTNAIATGATYQVKQGDEGFELEAKATVTNDNGVTISAASAPTASVIDNATIAVAVSVIGGGAVQEGQSLLAQATITGDPSDLGAPVSYQWQSSSDGGLTWINVAATAVGTFGAGVSSLYQLAEGDEGKTFRAVASFTDDTGQVVSSTSAATTTVAYVTPVITVPFSYAADDLSIVKNGTQIYNDTFSQAPPASPSILTNGVPTPVAFVTLGGTWTESNGKAIFSSAGAAPNPALAGSVEDFAELNTNTDPTSNLGLKLATGFTVSSTFDLVAPPTGSYGMELNDGTPTHGVDQLERLIVAKVNGNTVVELVQANLTTNTQTVLASQTLTSAQLAGNNQIEFQFNHAANAQTVSGSFELIDAMRRRAVVELHAVAAGRRRDEIERGADREAGGEL